MASFEEECIERYFLAPGGSGPIGSVYVADEDLLEIFEVNDIEEARRRLIRLLPPSSNLKDFLSGELPPSRGAVPSYLRLLMFLCWMQTTKTRLDNDRQFHEMFERHLGYRPWSMNGLNTLWEHLRDHLKRTYDIHLDLPDILPYKQIGRTLRIAFPTWRDKQVLARVRETMASATVLDPQAVAVKVKTSGGVDPERNPALKHNFDTFDIAYKQGGDEYIGTAFWQAWYSVVSQDTALDGLEVAPGEFGELVLFRATPVGKKISIRVPEDAVDHVPSVLQKAIRSGEVPMEDVGFGKSHSAIGMETDLFLVRNDKLEEPGSEEPISRRTIGSHWALARYRNRTRPEPARRIGVRQFGWRDGIRVGGSMLGRSPYAPALAGPSDGNTRVLLNGQNVAMISDGENLRFPAGVFSGQAIGERGTDQRSVRLSAQAIEFGEARRLPFDPSRDISEDLFHRGTAPSSPPLFKPWPGERVSPHERLIDIGEALYARTARGLSFIDALEIVRRGLSGVTDAPRDWDILRTFADAGWFDLTTLRKLPARRVLQRKLVATPIGCDAVLVCGPTPIAVIERLTETAKASGATLEALPGMSAWSLPRLLVRCLSSGVQDEFLRRAKLGVPERTSPAAPRHGDMAGVHGYRVNARFDQRRGFFLPQEDQEMSEGLYRLEHVEGKSPVLYRSVASKQQAESFESSSVAILIHHARQGRDQFYFDGGLLKAAAPRVSLPSSWAQWISDRTACNAGLRQADNGWEYAYPIGESEVTALSTLLTIARKETGSRNWIDNFVASGSKRGRPIYDATTQQIRNGIRASGKRHEWQ